VVLEFDRGWCERGLDTNVFLRGLALKGTSVDACTDARFRTTVYTLGTPHSCTDFTSWHDLIKRQPNTSRSSK